MSEENKQILIDKMAELKKEIRKSQDFPDTGLSDVEALCLLSKQSAGWDDKNKTKAALSFICDYLRIVVDKDGLFQAAELVKNFANDQQACIATTLIVSNNDFLQILNLVAEQIPFCAADQRAPIALALINSACTLSLVAERIRACAENQQANIVRALIRSWAVDWDTIIELAYLPNYAESQRAPIALELIGRAEAGTLLFAVAGQLHHCAADDQATIALALINADKVDADTLAKVAEQIENYAADERAPIALALIGSDKADAGTLFKVVNRIHLCAADEWATIALALINSDKVDANTLVEVAKQIENYAADERATIALALINSDKVGADTLVLVAEQIENCAEDQRKLIALALAASNLLPDKSRTKLLRYLPKSSDLRFCF